MESSAELIKWILENLNYWVVTLFMTIESSFIPFPSEVIVPPAAWKSMADESMNIFLVIVFATIGADLGALINYYLAKWLGRPIVYKFANSRFGHMCLINEEKIRHAEEYFRMINPIEHARTKDAAWKYKVEPYVIAADIYSNKNLAGRGGWTWSTGSSSWMYIAGIQYVLGLNIADGYLWLNPNIASSWREYSIRYKWKETTYQIKVRNPNGKQSGITKMLKNGEEVPDKKIKLEANMGTIEIDAEM